MQAAQMKRFLSRNEIKTATHMTVSERWVDCSCGLHWHNFFEIELILEGEGFQLLNGKRVELSRGCVSLLRLTDFHQVVPTKTLRLLNLMLDESLLPTETLNQLVGAGQTMFFRLEEQPLCTMESLFRLCMEENNAPSPDPRYLSCLLECICNRLFHERPLGFALPAAPKSPPIQEALLYLHLHFRENPRLRELAQIAHYNTSYFSIAFHRELGMTYCEYLNMLKISYAKQLLLSTELKISDICYECGFASHANFLRLFKTQVGLSPLQFRKMGCVSDKWIGTNDMSEKERKVSSK